MIKQSCEKCGDQCNQEEMVATPGCEWICTYCFAEAPEAYGFDVDMDGSHD